MTIRNPLAGLAAAGLLSFGVLSAQAEPLHVGIANFGEHPQLAQAVNGFKAALTDAGYAEGTDITYTESHTNFDTTLLPQMIARLQSEQPDLLYVITTPVAQIAKNALKDDDTPIVFSAVTDPVAANLVPSWDVGDTTMTGASDLQDIAAILTFAKALLPGATRLGVPYNPGEANDVALLDKIKAEAATAGFEVVGVGVDNVNDIQQRITSLTGKADVIYVPASNLIQPAIAAVAAAAREAGIPIINSDEGPVIQGIVPASFAVNYSQVGNNAGRIAAQILSGADPAGIAPVVPAYEDHAPVISSKSMANFGVEIPAAFADCGCIIH